MMNEAANTKDETRPSSDRTSTVPSDIRELTIRNLDTGEEFIIGENDPDFDFDTFEIGGVAAANSPGTGKDTGTTVVNAATNAEEGRANPTERIGWWKALMLYLYGSSNPTSRQEQESRFNNEQTIDPAPKTPFTKLSSFKFRKELGKGAFGRVLLAEAKQDGKLYALKIISKKNMRSSDKRQAKAERDILYAMALKAPHPFTSGLKFAFQSENNLYLGMDFIPGGNLRELIKKFKRLPEVLTIAITISIVLFVTLLMLHILIIHASILIIL